jgi:hypothetical protein
VVELLTYVTACRGWSLVLWVHQKKDYVVFLMKITFTGFPETVAYCSVILLCAKSPCHDVIYQQLYGDLETKGIQVMS